MPTTSASALSAGGGVGAVVALKAGELVKSRLAPLPQPLRRRLAWTMAVDTLHALVTSVEAVVVVSDQPALAHRLARAGLSSVVVVPETRPAGMNDALRQGAERLRGDGLDRVLACVGDLPALRPTSVAVVLRGAVAYERSYLPDATGIGTSMLHAGAGVALAPHFQGRSAAAHHSSSAVPLTDERLATAVPDARRDVDTEVDLADAVGLGLGPATAALVDDATGRLGTYAAVTTVGREDGAGRAVTSEGVRVDLPDDRLADGLRALRPGQRLHAVLTGTSVLSAWL
ncbi:2-phospho-L-lactate guanylyltransferase [Microlunatus antarcticus]|uniref:2-phospho-L-lactate guanylyltransferase n=1 Tax=Microlunatus antarcticus TaxID=53388 RepID=A0A7W5JUL4_9ACTN|nr:2-phospho-L-lactate guanylyltransferase [Microlunatus antarcticus]MBB3326515.1 2-phospho-L-lactate guanylyltransferase [Microlunatus antarcticus]